MCQHGSLSQGEQQQQQNPAEQSNDNSNDIDKSEQHEKEELGRRWVVRQHAEEEAKKQTGCSSSNRAQIE